MKMTEKEKQKIAALFEEWNSRASYTDDEVDLEEQYVDGKGIHWALVVFYAGYLAGKEEKR
jgi:hypothetical protein